MVGALCLGGCSGEKTLNAVWQIAYFFGFIVFGCLVKSKMKIKNKKNDPLLIFLWFFFNFYTDDDDDHNVVYCYHHRDPFANCVFKTCGDSLDFSFCQGSRQNKTVKCPPPVFHTSMHQSQARERGPKRSQPSKRFIKVNNGVTSSNQLMPH